MWFLSCWWDWRLLSHSGIGGNIVHLSNQCQRCQAVSAFSRLWRCQSCIGHEAMGWSNQWMVYSLASLKSHNFVAQVLYWCHFGLLSCWCHRHIGILLDSHLSLKQARRFLMAMWIWRVSSELLTIWPTLSFLQIWQIMSFPVSLALRKMFVVNLFMVRPFQGIIATVI
jgi:hypothetical protein